MPPLKVILGYVFIVVVGGTGWAAIKVGVAQVPPFQFLFERNALLAVILTALVSAMRLQWPRNRTTIVTAVAVGVLYNGIGSGITYWSEQYVSSGLVSVYGASSPIWGALFAHYLVRNDRLSPAKILGLALGLAGVALLVGTPELGLRPEAVAARVLLLLFPISLAGATILQVRLLRQQSPIPLVAIGAWGATAAQAPLALSQLNEPAQWTIGAGLALLYLVVFPSALVMVVQMWLTRWLRVTTMTMVQVIVPAEALLIGALAFGEALTLSMLAGVSFILTGLTLNAVFGRGRPTSRLPVGTGNS